MKKKFIRIISFLFIIIITGIYCYAQNNWIDIEKIQVDIEYFDESLNGFKIVHVSDIHIPKNASSIKNIVNLVRNENPDIIAITGDIIDANFDINKDIDSLSYLCKEFSSITTTYAVSGNHDIWSKYYDKWVNVLIDNNIKYIDNSTDLYTKNGQNILFIGLKYGEEIELKNIIEKENIYKHSVIVLTHRPELITLYEKYLKNINYTLVLAGHEHGGQFRIPFIDVGLISPGQGFLPKNTSGICYSDTGLKMIVSRGLGNSVIPIRINNRPNIPVIELISK